MSNKYLEKVASMNMYDAPKLTNFGKAPKIIAGALGAMAGIGAGQALKKNLEKKAGISISGVKNAVGKFGKNLTGETVRETRTAVNLHKDMNHQFKSQHSVHTDYMNTVGSALKSSKNGDKSFYAESLGRAMDENRNISSGMSRMSETAEKHVPFKSESDLASAIKSRNRTRAATGAVVGAAAVGASVRKNKIKN